MRRGARANGASSTRQAKVAAGRRPGELTAGVLSLPFFFGAFVIEVFMHAALVGVTELLRGVGVVWVKSSTLLLVSSPLSSRVEQPRVIDRVIDWPV